MDSEYWIVKDLEGSLCDLIYKFPRLSYGMTEKNQERLIQVFLPRFEFRISQMQIKNGATCIIFLCFFFFFYVFCEKDGLSVALMRWLHLRALHTCLSSLASGSHLRKNIIIIYKKSGSTKLVYCRFVVQVACRN
jgi:hypothetical protein